MKIKPKEILVNLPVALLFNEPWEVASFASNINTILHGKVRLKAEELGVLGNRFVGLFYLQRNNEYHQIRDEFLRLIEEEQMNSKLDNSFVPSLMNYDGHYLCADCEALSFLHKSKTPHCICGEEWLGNICRSQE